MAIKMATEIIAVGIMVGMALVGAILHTIVITGAMHIHHGMATDTGADHKEVGL